MSWKVKARARTNEWDLGKSTARNGEDAKEQIAVLFDYVDANGETGSITWYGYFTEKTWERTLDSLRYMGWKGDDLGNLDGLDSNEVELVLDVEEYQGKRRTKVQWVNRLQALALQNPMDQKERQSFASKMRGRIAQHNQVNGAQRRAAAPQPRTSAATPSANQYDGPPDDWQPPEDGFGF